jgi:DNA invertase Pin-like site-specific DNA recombinase
MPGRCRGWSASQIKPKRRFTSFRIRTISGIGSQADGLQEREGVKTNKKFVCYLRVSTDRQGERGLGIAAQRAAVASYIKSHAGERVAECVEVESGKKTDRPQLNEALRLCRLHDAVLLIAKLDRLARNVHFVSGLMEAKVDFIACDFPEANRLTIHIIAAVAEHEAKMISERTKAALAQVKLELKKGRRKSKTSGKWHKRLGNPRWAKSLGEHSRKGGLESVKVRRKQAKAKAEDLLPVVDIIRAKGIVTLQGIATELNRRGHRAPRGGEWASAQVWHLLRHETKIGAAA